MNRFLRSARPNTNAPRYRLIKNSETIMVGDWLTDESAGVADADAVTEEILGLCTAIVTKDGVSLESFSANTGALGGTWTSSTKQYAAAADNQTVDGVMAEYIPAFEDDEFVATLDAAKGTTTGSNVAGYNLAVVAGGDSSLLDESTASATETNTQFQIVDPLLNGSTTEVVVRVKLRESNL